jgi:predicted nucleic acid-binding protein
LVILFCDTSALIKLLISEPGSGQMEQTSSHAQAIAVCRITWVEAMAGMARRQREDPVSSEKIEQARAHLITSWDQFTIVEVNQRLVETAGRFADVVVLRGYDIVQLAAAHEPDQSTDQPLTFACFDRRLKQAASLLQLEVLA